MLCSLGSLESRLWENLPYSSLVASLDFPGGSEGKESACNSGDLDSIPRLGREWQSTPVFLSGDFYGEFLPRFHSRGTWRAAVHEITKSWTQLSN